MATIIMSQSVTQMVRFGGGWGGGGEGYGGGGDRR